MKKTYGSTVALLFFVLVNYSEASDFSYTYLEASANFYDEQAEIESSHTLSGSLALNDHMNVFVGANTTKLKRWGSSVEQYQLGMGTHFSQNENTDLVFSAAAINANHQTGFGLSAGFRTKLHDKAEGNASFGYRHMPSRDISEADLTLGGRVYFNNVLSVGAHYSFVQSQGNYGNDSENILNSSLRMSFF